MLPKKMEKALNDQLKLEFYSSNIYLAMASWAETEGLAGCASFLYEQAKEELAHMEKILRYINETGGKAIIPALDEPPAKYKNIKEVFESALKHEKKVTASINNLVDIAISLKDHATNSFLQWYVTEQLEEETTFGSIMDIIKLAGIEGGHLYLFDKEIGGMRSAAPAAE